MVHYNKEVAVVHHYIDIRRFEEAKSKLHYLMQERPNEGELHYLLAFCDYRLNQYACAAESCEEALRLGYDQVSGKHLLGTIYQEQKRFQEAESLFLEVLNIVPDRPEVLVSYGNLMIRTGHEEKAIELTEEALKLDPENGQVLQLALHIYSMKQDKKMQMELIERVMASSSDEVQKLVQLGLIHYMKKDYGEAREQIRQAFLLDPTNNGVHEILVELDELTHPFFVANRFIDRIGGPAVVWVLAIAIIYGLRLLKLDIPLFIFAVFYIILVIMSWASAPLYKLLIKKRGI